MITKKYFLKKSILIAMLISTVTGVYAEDTRDILRNHEQQQERERQQEHQQHEQQRERQQSQQHEQQQERQQHEQQQERQQRERQQSQQHELQQEHQQHEQQQEHQQREQVQRQQEQAHQQRERERQQQEERERLQVNRNNAVRINIPINRMAEVSIEHNDHRVYEQFSGNNTRYGNSAYQNNYYQGQPVYQHIPVERIVSQEYVYPQSLNSIPIEVSGKIFGTWIYSNGNEQRKIVGYYEDDRLFLKSFTLDGSVEISEYWGSIENGLSHLQRVDGDPDRYLIINQDDQLEFWNRDIMMYAAPPQF